MVLSVIALVLLAVAPFGWRLGWWPYSFGLYWLMPASGFVGVVAVSLCVLTLALGWSELRPRSLGVLSVALCLSAALVYVPWQYSRLRSTLPPIHDITTDTDNPPAFSAVLPARAAEHAGGVNYDDPKLPQLQKAAYPDLAALKAAFAGGKGVQRGPSRRQIYARLDHHRRRCRYGPHRGNSAEPLVPVHR